MSRASGRPRLKRGMPKPVNDSASRTAKRMKISQAAELIGVKPFVLRFWETQFSFLKPRHAGSKQRSYLTEDIENFRLVKRLLHEQRFTIEGARKLIDEIGLERVRVQTRSAGARIGATPRALKAGGGSAPSNSRNRAALNEIRRELESIRRLLRR